MVPVQFTGNNCCIVPWSVVMVDPSSSFDDLLRSLKVGKYSIVLPSVGSEFLSRAIIENVATCWKGQTVSIVGDDMNVCDVCRSFDSNVRLQVEGSQDHTATLKFYNMLI